MIQITCPPRWLKKVASLNKHNKNQNEIALDFLHQYHDPNHPSPFKSRTLPLCPVTANKKRKCCKKPSLEHNPYLGALYLRQFSLLLLPEADNANLRTNIIGFGVWNHALNQSPPVYHHQHCGIPIPRRIFATSFVKCVALERCERTGHQLVGYSARTIRTLWQVTRHRFCSWRPPEVQYGSHENLSCERNMYIISNILYWIV